MNRPIINTDFIIWITVIVFSAGILYSSTQYFITKVDAIELIEKVGDRNYMPLSEGRVLSTELKHVKQTVRDNNILLQYLAGIREELPKRLSKLVKKR